jgi:hypothetical protein
MLEYVQFRLFDYLLIGIIYTVSYYLSVFVLRYQNIHVITLLIYLLIITYYIIFRFYY